MTSSPRRPSSLGFPAALFLLSACGSTPTSYSADVQGLLAENCVSCHQQGGIAPFSLDSYQAARARAADLVRVVRARTMPPVPATADGSCQRFVDARWLTAAEQAVLVRWLEQGTPEGQPVPAAAPPAPAHLPEGALTLRMAEPYSPTPLGGEPDRYRCFALEPGLATRQYVTAAEFLPGDAAQVHHLALFAVDPTRSLGSFTNAEGVAAMEADDPEPGWECYGSLGAVQPRSQLPSWFGGDPVVRVPAGYGMPLLPGEWVILQVHYRAKPTPQPDQTTIRLQFADAVEHPLIAIFRDPITFATGVPPKLAPGLEAARFEWSLPAADFEGELRAQGIDGAAGFRLVGVAAHMHELGVGYQLELRPPGAPATCGLDIRRWDFHWQRSYFYQAPIDVGDPATEVRVQCTYDTRGLSSPVFAGHDKGREMCSVVAYIAAL